MIKIQGLKKWDDKRQIAYFRIDGQEFSCGNVPAELTKVEDVQTHLDSRADEFKLLLLKMQYPQSDHLRFQVNNKTEIEALEEWISKGHKNKIQIGLTAAGNPKYGYALIEKRELTYRHPKWVGLVAKIEASNVDKEIKELLKEIVK